MMRPRGTPPTPSAISRLKLPVGIDSTCILVASPNFITAPSPYFLLRLARVVSSAFCLPLSTFVSFEVSMSAYPLWMGLNYRTKMKQVCVSLF